MKNYLHSFQVVFISVGLLVSGLSGITSAQSYCIPADSDCESYGEGLDHVTFNTISHLRSGCAAGGYGDFTHISTNVQRGETHMLSIQPLSESPVGITVWIDWNDNGIFSAADRIWSSTSALTSAAPASVPVTVPLNASFGDVRMRIAATPYKAPAADKFCGPFDFGEVHDYTIHVATPDLPAAIISSTDTIWTGSTTRIISQSRNYNFKQWYINGDPRASDNGYLIFPDTTTGQYTLSLTANNQWGQDSTYRDIVVANPYGQPEASFFATQFHVPLNEVVSLIDRSKQAETLLWQIERENGNGDEATFVEGTNENSRYPSIMLSEGGYYSVTLDVSNAFGNDQATMTNLLRAGYAMCNSEFSSDANGMLTDSEGSNPHGSNQECSFLINPCAENLRIFFEDFALSCGTGRLRIYDGFDNTGTPLHCGNGFTGGGTQQCSQSCVPMDTLYAESGAFYIELETANNTGNNLGFDLRWLTDEKSVGPNAGFTVRDTVCTESWISFQNNSRTAGTSKFYWDYTANETTDDTTMHGRFNYDQAGTYTARLVTEDCESMRDTFDHEVVVMDAVSPDADLLASDYNPWKDEIITLSAEIEGCYDSLEWQISPAHFVYVNGTNAQSEKPEIRFTRDVCFDITLNLYNASGQRAVTESCLVDVKGYCMPNIGYAISDIGIRRLRLQAIDHVTPTGNAHYSDFTGEIFASLEVGKEYAITLERQTNMEFMERGVWIDFVPNGNFTDSLEMVAEETNAKTLSYTDTFRVPGHAEVGITRLRAGVIRGGNTIRPCGGQEIGEYIDYEIRILPNTLPPELTLLGPNPLYMDVFDQYPYPGAEVWDVAFGDLTADVEVDLTGLDVNTLGTYIVTYSVTDPAGNTATAEREVIVEDNEPPSIFLLGDDTVYVEVHTFYPDPGVDITDNYWPNIQPSVTDNIDFAELGIYEREYCATDGSGNGPVCVTRVIIVEDTTPPEISMDEDTVVAAGLQPFTDPGIQVTDNYWPIDSITVDTGGTFENTNNLGFFTRTYIAADASGNVSDTALRIVHVADKTPPEISLNGDAEIFIPQWEPFIDPGVTVIDDFDPNPAVDTGGTFVNTDEPGLYNRTYVAVDSSGNVSEQVQRLIVVQEGNQLQQESGQADDVRIYPNPARKSVMIDLVWSENLYTRATVFDLSGRIYLQAELMPNRVTSLNIEKLEAGSYIIRLSDADGNNLHKKLIIE